MSQQMAAISSTTLALLQSFVQKGANDWRSEAECEEVFEAGDQAKVATSSTYREL